jgi:hypothetical protein
MGSDPKKKGELQVELMIWRINMQAKVQSGVQLEDSICFQMSPNWFLGIRTLDPI